MFPSAQTQLNIPIILCCSSFTLLIGISLKNNTPFKSTLLVIALAASSASTQAFALDNMNEANQNAYTTSFKALDIDNSETLTESEAQKEKLFAKNFAAADKNHDGSLNEEEYSNYRSQVEQKNVKRVANDSLTTSKVKANLLKEEGLKSLKVSVKTHQGVVLLSGFVETEAQIHQAEKIAAETEGVTSVKNSLILKKD
jgi:hyperosmotically inducible protein